MKGLTLIELMIIVCIIGILLAVAMPYCLGHNDRRSSYETRQQLVEVCYEDCQAMRDASLHDKEMCMQECDMVRTELLFNEYGSRAGIYTLDSQ